MDHIDRKIIDLLQNNARAPLKEIADHVFLSSPAVSARMARLESSGTITGYQAQVDAPKLGYMVKAFINLDMDPQRKPEFYPYIQSCPHVVECNCVTGDYSMLIEVLFGTTQELDQFINHLQQFGRTRTQIVFSTPVEHRGVPVAEPEEKKQKAFPIGGRWPSEARSDEGEACAVSRKRDIAGNAALISPLSPMGKPFSVISIPRSAEQRSSLSASGRREGSSGQCSSRSARPHGPCSCS